MLAARDRAGKHVTIGYQWSMADAIQRLKSEVLSGLFGKPRRLRTMVLWPRDDAYYSRNRWAGRVRDADGNWILDSPVNNACAHHLHNMLYLLGARPDRSAAVHSLRAELYRAHAIENYDTAILRCETANGAEIFFVAGKQS